MRDGRVYRSPLAATGALQISDWVRDDLPDLLWPVLVLSQLGTAGARRFLHWQKAVQQDLAGKVELGALAGCLDGRLTNLDRLTTLLPDSHGVVRTRAQEQGLLPESVVSVLASYPLRPAKWLVSLDVTPPGQADIDLLARALLEVLRDNHRHAVIKCLQIWSAVQAGAFSTDARMIELLKPYPNDPATRDAADSVVRAAWGAQKSLLLHNDEDYFVPAIRWARAFWGANSMTTRCRRSRDSDADSDDTAEDEVDLPSGHAVPRRSAAPAAMPEEGVYLRQLAMDLLSSYVEALETSPARLYDRERQEVCCGLVVRAGREVITALGAPDLWCMEHGSHIIRVLVESRIYMQWMAQADPSIYRSFQDYGAGKAKLYARIMEELPEDVKRADFRSEKQSRSLRT